jgi:hypothetical protein
MNLSSLVRNIDPDTSLAAARAVEPRLSDLQKIVWEYIRSRGTVIDSDLVAWGISQGYAESTLRKRRTELSQMGLLELVGQRKNQRGRKELVWQVTPSQIAMF